MNSFIYFIAIAAMILTVNVIIYILTGLVKNRYKQ